jgi:hypothetical protein
LLVFLGGFLVASLAVIWFLWWLPGCSLGGFGGGSFLVVFVVVQLVAPWWSSFASWVSFGLFYIVLGECGRLSSHSSSLCSHTWEVVGQHPIVPSIVFFSLLQLSCGILPGLLVVSLWVSLCLLWWFLRSFLLCNFAGFLCGSSLVF